MLRGALAGRIVVSDCVVVCDMVVPSGGPGEGPGGWLDARQAARALALVVDALGRTLTPS
ncbi:hypothetical protein GCM10009814_17910 [Lapillicoccus jejuensis]